jgi:hypothetical protein
MGVMSPSEATPTPPNEFLPQAPGGPRGGHHFRYGSRPEYGARRPGALPIVRPRGVVVETSLVT